MVPTNLKIAAGVFALVIAFMAGYQYADNSWQAEWDEAEKQTAQNQMAAVNAAVKVYKDRELKIQENSDETDKKLDTVSADSDSAGANAGSLQQSFSDSLQQSSGCTTSTPTTRELAAIATERTVQAFVFERVSRRAVEYAKIADENRVRGLACEVNYNSLRF